MKILAKEVGEGLQIIDCDKNFIRKLYRKGYQKLKFSFRYKIYVSYTTSIDEANYNCALSTPREPIPLQTYGAFYVKKKLLFWHVDVREYDLNYINKFIDKSIKNYR